MANKLSDEVQVLVQRSGTNTGGMRTEAERASFSANVRKDIAAIVYQINVVYQELVSTLSSVQGLNALDFGLAGDVIFTHITASEASADAYWSADQVRARTIKETIDVLIAEISRLENELQAALDSDGYDDTSVRSLIGGNSLNLKQLALDTMGPAYTLDGDGAANMTYALSQAIDAIGAFFNGFPGTGNSSYTTTYPALSFTVLLSAIAIDTTLAQSVITGLPADLGYIRDFIGMNTAGPESPTYTFWSPNVFINNGWSLEKSISILDSFIGNHAVRHISSGADEIDGDRLDIDWVPTNYTRTVDPLALSIVHLTAHLKGIDTALAGIGGQTLQGGYDAGGAGTAGNVQLLNSKGKMRILDDASTPINVMLEWIDSSSTSIGQLRDTGLALQNDGFLEIEEASVDPATQAGVGRFNVRPDPTSSNSELFYQNSDGSDSNAQVTRDGIVKELEVGHSVLYANHWYMLNSPASAPSLEITELSDNVLQTLDFDSETQEDAYSQLPIPQDEQGNRPTRLKLIGYWMLKPVLPAAYAGGTGFVIGIANSDAGSHKTIVDRALLTHTWSVPASITKAVSTSDRDKLLILEYPIRTLGSNTLGLFNLKMTRLTADGADNYGDDVGCICVHAIWYR